ncbi:MAG: response regulator transcription factor [Elusimicrobiota bacterium]|jgi:two-component system response regulator ResD
MVPSKKKTEGAEAPLPLPSDLPAPLRKILVVDDDRTIRGLISKYLTQNGYSVVHTDNGSEALVLVRESRPDLILVDAQMPGLDGHAVCRVLKKEAATTSTPVIIMSGSKIEERDVLAGFEGGADDYILKPFSLPVLRARIQAVLRRYAARAGMTERLRKCGIELDPAGRTARVSGHEVSLTRKEFDLLASLIAGAGRALSVPYLLETVWGYDPADYNDPGTVEVHVSHLRKKLGPKAARHIVSVTGHGYKFEE